MDGFWKTVWDYQREQTPETERAIRGALTVESTKWQYLTGVPDQSLVSPDGARAFAADVPEAEIHLLDGGHFLLESAGDEVAELIRDFLGRVTAAR